MINLILVPLTIKYVSVEEYGVWLTIVSIVTWFSVFDIGLGNGLRNKLSELIAIENFNLAKIYLSTSYVFYLIAFSLLCVSVLLISNNFNYVRILGLSNIFVDEVNLVVKISFSLFCAQMVLKNINYVAMADHRPFLSLCIDFISQLIVLLCIAMLVVLGKGSLFKLCLVYLGVPVLVSFIVSIILYGTLYKKIAPNISLIDFRKIKDIADLGFKFFVIQIAVIVIYQSNNVIISYIAGPEMVSSYNISFRYFGVVYMLFGIYVTPFWSAYTGAYIKGDMKWMQASIKKLELFAKYAIIVLFLMLLGSKYAYKLWIGELLNINFSLSVCVCIYFVTNIYRAIYMHILNGIGKIKLQLIVTVISAVLHIPLAIFMGGKIGVEGVVVSAIIMNLLVLFYAPLQARLLINNRAEGVWSA